MLRSFKYRLYPNKEVTSKLSWTLARCRELYNAALSERKDAYQKHERTVLYQNEQGHVIAVQMQANLKVSDVSYLQQKRDLVEIKEVREEYQEIASHVLQDVMLRLEKGMKAFYRRIREGQTPGFPRFQGRNRYTSFTYPDGAGWKVQGNILHLSKIGDITVKLHRPIQGTIKTVTIKCEGDHWYVTFSCEVSDEERGTHTPYTDDALGIDLGLLHFATLSTGDMIENPRFFRKGQADLTRKQQKLSRCKGGSHRRDKAKKQASKAHRKIRNQRRDFLHKQSHQVVATYETLVFEDLSPAKMSRAPKPKHDETGKFLPNGAAAKGGGNKSILDAGWGTFVSMCQSKAAWAGSVTVLTVNPYNTSQVCSGCGVKGDHKDLSVRVHTCVSCGLVLDRDHNAARNILAKGLTTRSGGTRPTGSNL